MWPLMPGHIMPANSIIGWTFRERCALFVELLSVGAQFSCVLLFFPLSFNSALFTIFTFSTVAAGNWKTALKYSERNYVCYLAYSTSTSTFVILLVTRRPQWWLHSIRSILVCFCCLATPEAAEDVQGTGLFWFPCSTTLQHLAVKMISHIAPLKNIFWFNIVLVFSDSFYRFVCFVYYCLTEFSNTG